MFIALFSATFHNFLHAQYRSTRAIEDNNDLKPSKKQHSTTPLHNEQLKETTPFAVVENIIPDVMEYDDPLEILAQAAEQQEAVPHTKVVPSQKNQYQYSIYSKRPRRRSRKPTFSTTVNEGHPTTDWNQFAVQLLEFLAQSNCKVITFFKTASRFDTIPDGIIEFIAQQCPNLEELDLRNTYVEKLPCSINQLTKLKKLNLSGTRISAFPNKLSHLQHLKEINLANTGMDFPLAHPSLNQTPTKVLKRLEVLQEKFPNTAIIVRYRGFPYRRQCTWQEYKTMMEHSHGTQP